MRVAAVFLAILLLSTAQPADRLPVPDQASQLKAEKTIKDLFRTEYAKKKSADQVELAGKLLKQAEETNDDSTGRFVLLREARDIAARAGDAAWRARLWKKWSSFTRCRS
jgi:hypothetical protein